jgi:hypothetical protein
MAGYLLEQNQLQGLWAEILPKKAETQGSEIHGSSTACEGQSLSGLRDTISSQSKLA